MLLNVLGDPKLITGSSGRGAAMAQSASVAAPAPAPAAAEEAAGDKVMSQGTVLPGSL